MLSANKMEERLVSKIPKPKFEFVEVKEDPVFFCVNNQECIEYKKPETKVIKLDTNKTPCYNVTGEINSKKSFNCNICGKFFSRRYNLHKHVKTHENNKRYDCNFCLERFKWKQELKEHRKVHNITKTFAEQLKCQLCSRTFKYKSNLVVHAKSHIEKKKKKKNLRCEICCKGYKMPCNLIKHMEKHEISCRFCDKKFMHKSKLTRHIREHSKPTYDCKLCNRKFLFSLDLKQHLVKFNEHKCDSCHKSISFKNRDEDFCRCTWKIDATILEQQTKKQRLIIDYSLKKSGRKKQENVQARAQIVNPSAVEDMFLEIKLEPTEISEFS